MNFAAIHSLAYKTSTRSVIAQSMYRKLFIVCAACAMMLFVSYLFLAIAQIGMRHDVATVKSDIKKLQEQNSEFEILLAGVHTQEPTETRFIELGLVKSKNVSYIEMPAQSFVRASNE